MRRGGRIDTSVMSYQEGKERTEVIKILHSIFLNAFEAQNLFQNDLDKGGIGFGDWLNVQEEKLQEPMWPMQWPSSSKVASVSLRCIRMNQELQ